MHFLDENKVENHKIWILLEDQFLKYIRKGLEKGAFVLLPLPLGFGSVADSKGLELCNSQ